MLNIYVLCLYCISYIDNRNMDKLFVFLGKYLFSKMKDFIPGIDPFTFAKHTCLSVLDITHAHEHIINNGF